MKTQREVNSDLKMHSSGYAEQLDAIFQAFPDLLFRLDASGKILEYRDGNPSNRYAAPDEFLGKRVQDVMPAEISRKYMAGIEKIHETNQVVSFEYDHVISGREVSFEARMVKSSGSNIYAIIRDITNQRQTSDQLQRQLQQLEALRSIDSAISSSYDLNMILFVILTQATTQLKVDAADILLTNPIGETLDFTAGRGFKTELVQHTHLPVGKGFAGQVACDKCLIHIPDIRDSDPGFIHPALISQEKFIGYIGIPLTSRGHVKGVLEIFHRTALIPDSEWFYLLNTLAGQAAIAIENASTFMELQQSNRELALAYDATIEGWSQALELRDSATQGHARRVTQLTLKLARLVGLDEKQIVHIQRGALLHDIGKMGIPDAILQKKGTLSTSEIEIMHRHPLYAFQMLSAIPFLRPAMDIPVYHHEKWDGSGYPYGLQGEQIPLSARIFSLVDIYDALTSDRPFQKALAHREALSYFHHQSGTHFDPSLVPLALKVFNSKNEADK